MIKIKDEFWSQRINTVNENTLPSMYNQLHETGRWDFVDFNWKEGVVPHIFWDSDIAKFLEALCYAIKYADEETAKLYHGWINEAVRMIIKAQEPDGYLNSYFSQVKPEGKFKNVSEEHELYCAGHLTEAAIAHYKVTGNRDLLDCLCRYIDLICDLFGSDSNKMHGYPGHQEIELALVKLIEIVPEERYIELLNYFIEQRGYNNGEFYDQQARERGIDPDTYKPLGDYDHLNEVDYDSSWPEPRSYWYFQADKQIRELSEIKGHSVRAVYYLTAVQALATRNDDESLREAVKRLFRNMIDKKFYIHGGIGSITRWEGFGEEYDLRWDGYSETCASIGLIFLCEKLLQDKLDQEVAKVMERALYNNVLGGVSIKGESYFYNQPITGKAGLKRQDWFSVSCCPPNVARLFSSLEKYALLVSDERMVVNLYIGTEGTFEDKHRFKLLTKYPFEGFIELEVTAEVPIEICIREPDFSFTCSNRNYKVQNGYIIFDSKKWNETITIKFDISPRIIKPDNKVKANIGHLAIERGPFVYALQNSGIKGSKQLEEITITEDAKFEEKVCKFHDAEYISLNKTLDGVDCEFVPYFITGNAIPGEDFRIWIKRNDSNDQSRCEIL